MGIMSQESAKSLFSVYRQGSYLLADIRLIRPKAERAYVFVGIRSPLFAQ
jgi:hypothetical protein